MEERTVENSDDGSIEVAVLTTAPGPHIHSPARLKFLTDIENANSGEQLVQANLEYAQHEKGQAAFAFNRAKKVLDHFNLLAGSKIHRGYGSMGKAKESFYALFNNLPPHIVEHLKNAMVWDSRISKSMKSGQSLFPDRHGREPAPEESGVDARSRKKKREHSELEEASSAADMKAVEGALAGQSPVEGDLPSPVISAVESEERIRSIKAARLADAVAHPSFQTLSADQQHVIKELWVQSLVGATTII